MRVSLAEALVIYLFPCQGKSVFSNGRCTAVYVFGGL